MAGFECPNCDGHTWGSSRNDDDSWTRHCHGEGRKLNCRYSWPESDDARHGIERPSDEAFVVVSTERS